MKSTQHEALTWIEDPTTAGWWVVDGSPPKIVELTGHPGRRLLRVGQRGVSTMSWELRYPGRRWAGPFESQDAAREALRNDGDTARRATK